ncbi:hypothetical protein PVAND_014901 [Polypedilum vanderplanki]|uniref:Peptidase aspartic putative domain-containing protein n=1 Tax=Polypedilum vanderplanki TaxID=319348 RepID=A0A9J6BBC4_POLVA|nr:hypothetical protein PVAND_014901 [Polypedilum vanderplanki]
MSDEERAQFVTNKNLCRNCLLTSDHYARDCALKPSCGRKISEVIFCSGKHHALLHKFGGNTGLNSNRTNYSNRGNGHANRSRRNFNNNTQRAQKVYDRNQTDVVDNSTNKIANVTQNVPKSGTEAQNSSTANLNTITTNPRFTYNVTAPIQSQNITMGSDKTIKVFKHRFFGPNGETIGYSVGDSGSEVTIMREDLREQLGIEGKPVSLNLQWTDSQIRVIPAREVSLQVKGMNKSDELITLNPCYAIDADYFSLPARSLDVEALKKHFPYLKEARFDSYFKATPILLIGSLHASCIEAIAPVLHGGENKPVGIKTRLGWSIYGGSIESLSANDSSCLEVTAYKSEENSQSDSNPDENLNKLLTYYSSFESLGIRSKPAYITDNERKAVELITNELRILPNGTVEIPLIWDILENKIIDKEGFARLATEEELNKEWPIVWYLPMSLVANINKIPIKYRNVYDASFDLLRPVFAMRMNKIVVTCDVKSMFHCIAICERDQQCQRILWRSDINQPMKTYIMKVMLFGPKSSPFSSQFVKNKTAEKWENIYPDAARLLKNLTYMDDSLTSEGSIEDAIRVSQQAIEILQSINWDLIGFQSNSVELLRALPNTHVKQQLIPLLSDELESMTTKVLGCSWDPKSDSFVYQFDRGIFVKIVTECNHRPTKRDQCSTVARLFDILGLVVPYTIRGRILLQRSWRKGIEWDEQISEEDADDWITWLKDIEKIGKLKIPRQYCLLNKLEDCENLELHVFCDAGKEAFAAVGYFVVTTNGKRHTNIVLAKAKVTPVKLGSKLEISEMPRLESLSCLIAARLCHTIVSLHSKLLMDIYLWSDSEIVLRWIKKRNHRLPKYAHSIIDEILELTTREQWNYVPSKANPADFATKFQQIDFCDNNNTWFKGPTFLTLAREFWPEQKNFSDDDKSTEFVITNINLMPQQFMSTVKLPPTDCPLASHDFIYRFSNSIKHNWTFQILTADDLERAELFIIRKMQHDILSCDIKLLKKGLPVKNKNLAQLNVFLDDQDIIRINSRVVLDPAIYPQRFSPVAPREHPLSTIFLFHIHEKFNHVCLELKSLMLERNIGCHECESS